MQSFLEILVVLSFPLGFACTVAYFYALREFRLKIESDHPSMWAEFSKNMAIPRPSMQIAYKALQQSKEGRLGGVELSQSVMKARAKAVRLLYVGMALFMVLLIVILFSS